VTVEVEFIVTEDEARLLLELVAREGLRAFYARTPAHFGIVDEKGGAKGGEKEKGRL